MFEKASRKKYRFNSDRGLLTIEDLWDLPLTVLDKIAKAYNRELKAVAEESFITSAKNGSVDLNNRFEIVKHVISVKLQEAVDREDAAAKKARKALLLETIAEKQIDAMKNKTLEELQKEADEL